MHNDIEYWTTLQSPASPSEYDVEIYKKYLIGSHVLLLGSTKELLDLATVAYDINPKYNNTKIINRNWLLIDSNFDTIIGDGIFSFGKDLNDSLLSVCSIYSKRLIARSFLKPSWKPKYATTFPSESDFIIKPKTLEINNIYCFYIWDF